MLAFHFPEVPGVPPIRESPARRFKAAAMEGWGLPQQMPPAEWKSSLATLGGEIDRADYHRARFDSVLASLKARRQVAGGPVFGDPGPARAAYCEAAGYLSAVRTAVDIIVYVAARRSGRSISAADKWEACKAILPLSKPQPTKYDTEDIKALRQHKAWFEILNLYRNCMSHRGWHDQSFGYFSRGDTAPEADDPAHNVMLVPDLASLNQRARPDKWAYTDRKWLDALVDEVADGTEAALGDLFAVWGIPDPPPGKIPLKDQPTVFLGVPLVRAILGQSPPTLHVFLTKNAARLFLESFKSRRIVLEGCGFRAIRRMTLHREGIGFLVAYDPGSLGAVAQLELFDATGGRLRSLHREQFAPSERNGPVTNTLWFKLPKLNRDTLYVLDYVDG